MHTVIYLLFMLLLFSAAYFVFNHLVASNYSNKGRLGWFAAFMQFLVFAGFFMFPYLYLPGEWIWGWGPNGTWNRLFALVLVSCGIILAFGTMLWFGLRRAFGLKVEGIIKVGPYRFSRNPQMLGGWLMVLGVFLYQPSLYNLGWVLMWVLIGHWMIEQEETHLRRQFGKEFESYCAETPRYIICK